MKRREFLSLCGLVAGSCLIPAQAARLIRETCILAHEPCLVLPRNPKSTLYAISNSGTRDFMLHFGDPRDKVEIPTWREYFDEYEGIDIDNQEEVEQWWRDQVGDPEEDPITIEAEEKIDGTALEKWEFQQEVYEGPAASAYRYLDDLPLDDGRGLSGDNPLGSLAFVEGDHPGSNLTYVEAPDLATLSCLQLRLNELGENLAIEIRSW